MERTILRVGALLSKKHIHTGMCLEWGPFPLSQKDQAGWPVNFWKHLNPHFLTSPLLTRAFTCNKCFFVLESYLTSYQTSQTSFGIVQSVTMFMCALLWFIEAWLPAWTDVAGRADWAGSEVGGEVESTQDCFSDLCHFWSRASQWNHRHRLRLR